MSIFFLFPKNLQAQKESVNSPNYYEYHKLINKAEYFYFIINKPDSSFYCYKTAFTNFEFVFARDCIIAAQLALLNKSNDNFLFFINKGFENGIELETLKQLQYLDKHRTYQRIAIFDRLEKDTTLYNKLKANYAIGRKKYLNRINTQHLAIVAKCHNLDQSNKNRMLLESDSTRNIRYSRVMKNNFKLLDSIIYKYGFPLEKLIGMNHKKVFEELKISDLNPEVYFNNLTDSFKLEHQLDIETFEFYLGFNCSIAFNQFIHYTPFYFKYKLLFNEGIKNGTIHPREVAILHDFRFGDSARYEMMSLYSARNFGLPFPPYNQDKRKYYLLNGVEIESLSLIDYINKSRKEIFVNTYEVDVAKKKYEVSNKLKLASFGFLFSY